MESEDYKEAERFVEEFKQIDFQVPFENLKKEVVSIDGQKYYKDLYLIEKLLPTLTAGMMELSRELEELMKNTDQIDPEVRSRFNPCLFLGQYLMRKNHNLTSPTSLSKMLIEYSQIENLNRFFISQFEAMHKIFVKSIGKDSKVCDVSELKLFSRDLDQSFTQDGALKTFLSNSRILLKNKEEIKFKDILEELAKYLVQKTHIREEGCSRILALK